MGVAEILRGWPVVRQIRARDLYGRGLTARADASPAPPQEPVGFFTDSSICIGCKACEVACREWNGLASEPGEPWAYDRSYDHTGGLGADSWRHVAFIEQESAG